MGLLHSRGTRRTHLHLLLAGENLSRAREDSRLLPSRTQRRRLREPARPQFRIHGRQSARRGLSEPESVAARRSGHPHGRNRAPRIPADTRGKKSEIMNQPHSPVVFENSVILSGARSERSTLLPQSKDPVLASVLVILRRALSARRSTYAFVGALLSAALF